MPIRHVGRLASLASIWPRDHFCRSTIAPRSSWPTTWNEFLPISMPMAAILELTGDMACSLSSVPHASFYRRRGWSTAGPSHYRTSTHNSRTSVRPTKKPSGRLLGFVHTGAIPWRTIAPPDRRITGLLIHGRLGPNVGCGWPRPHLLDDGLSVLSQRVVRSVSGDDQDAARVKRPEFCLIENSPKAGVVGAGKDSDDALVGVSVRRRSSSCPILGEDRVHAACHRIAGND